MDSLIDVVEKHRLIVIPLIILLFRPGFLLVFLGAFLQILGLWLKVPAILMLAPILLALLIRRKEVEQFQLKGANSLLIIILLFASVTRFTEISSFFGGNDFGWETPFGFMVSSSWDSVLTYGLKQPVISQGFLWYVSYFSLHHLFDDAVVAGRYFFASLSVVNILLVYLVAKNFFGQSVGVLSAAVFAFSPLEPAWAIGA